MHHLTLSSALAILVTAGTAAAAPASKGPPPLPAHLPPGCQPLAAAPPSAKVEGPILAAHLSVASCLAEHALAALTVTPDDASIAAMRQAVAPAEAILDGVIAVGDPYWTLLAEDARRDLAVGLAVRVRTSLAGDDPAARLALEDRIAPWLADAASAAQVMAALGKAHPDLATRDPVVAGALGRSTDGPPAKVASR